MEFSKVIKDRYSCKKYNGKEVEEEKLEKILEAGRVAPTAKNMQPQKIYVAKSKESLDIIDSVTPCRYGAPTVLVVAYDNSNIYKYPGDKHNSGIEDATIVATHMVLAAYNEGVDSCWLNFFDPDKLKEKLNLPENEEIVCLIDLGYKDENFKPLENHYIKKDLKDLVKEI